MKYGYKCHSTMCGLTFYIIEPTRQGCLDSFENFTNYLENKENTWEIYCAAYPIYCDEDSEYSFSVGKLDNGNYALVTDLGCGFDEEMKAIEFELIGTYTDRF